MNTIPTVTKNLLIINVLMFLGTLVAQSYGIDLNKYLGLHFFLAGDFLLPRMRYRRRNYSRARTVHSLRNGTFRIRQCQHRIFRHSHGRISQYDDYRRSFRSRLCHLAGIRYAVPQPALIHLSVTVPHQSQIFRYRIRLDRTVLGTCQQPGR